MSPDKKLNGRPAGLSWAVFVGLMLSIASTLTTPSACDAQNRLVLNEALANEPGGATSLEWIEILNWPDSGDGVSLEGHILIDGSDTTRFTTSLTLPPGGFAIVARRVIGESSFEAQWGNNSGVWGDHPVESFPALAGDISLRNATDTLVLVAPGGDTSAILWTHDAGDGISFERIRPNGDDAPTSFANCADPLGSTPGAANSVLPTRGDLALDSLQLDMSPNFGVDAVRVTFHVTNVGFGHIDWVTVEAYDDMVPEIEGDTLSRLISLPVGDFAEGVSAGFGFLWENVHPGRHRVIGRIVQDGNSSNNTAEQSIAVPFSSPLVVISEYLADPAVGGPDEWIEISNRAEFAINMSGCSIGDSSGLSAFPGSAHLMQPGEFWVLAENEAALRAHYPDFDGTLFQVPNWRSLNNTGDRIRLVGAAGEIVDSLSFRGGNGGNRSAERVDLSPILLDARYWSPSEAAEGATPGAANSVVPIEFDLTLDSVYVTPPSPEWDEAVDIHLRLINTGLQPYPGKHANLWESLDPSNPGSSLQSIIEYSWPGMPPDLMPVGDSVWVTMLDIDLAPGFHLLFVELSDDDNNANNGLYVTTTVRHTQPLVIVTEYLADPTTTGPGEWIECYNAANFPVSMFLTRIGDSTASSVISPFAGSIAPGTFWVLCEDETSFRAFYPEFNGLLLQVNAWRTLGNGGDGIRLIGAGGEIIDSLTYNKTYGDNRSAERINLKSELSQASDWTVSVDPSGATPGRVNSVSGEDAGAFEVGVSPNPFYLARGEETQISYRLEIGQTLTLKVFDRAGRLVRTLADALPAATGTTVWNGMSDGGGRVDPGPYVLFARADPDGGERKIVVVVGP